jgi:hypothetical protein
MGASDIAYTANIYTMYNISSYISSSLLGRPEGPGNKYFYWRAEWVNRKATRVNTGALKIEVVII